MPYHTAVAKELAELCKIVAHPDRIRIVEELHAGKRDVSSLAATLDLRAARVSQHLALLRASRHVVEQRSGRHHYYRLTQPKLAEWILDGLEFLEARMTTISPDDIANARRDWSATDSTDAH